MTQITPRLTVTKHKEYTLKLYDGLAQVAEADEHDNNLYTGYVSDVADALGIPRTHLSSVMTRLVSIEAIEQVVQGYRGQPSVILLKRHPSEIPDAFKLSLTRLRKPDTLSQRVDDLARQIGGMNLGEALVDLDERLSKVEKLVAGLNRNKGGKGK